MASGEEDSLSNNEKLMFDAIKKNDITDARKLLNEADVRIDCLDESGMSPLLHAAYNGSRDICELLIDHGADVNIDQHDHCYTALMFASLSNSLECVSLLLKSGASTTKKNSIGRTAAQMAAFVSNHEVVSLINNFLPLEELDYFTKPHGLEKNGKLPNHLTSPLHKLLLMTNIHPVKLAIYLEKNSLLLENVESISKVLEALCDKLWKTVGDENEIIILKIHHINAVLKACGKSVKEKSLPALVKSWLKGRENDGFPVNLETFLRRSIREFPYHDSLLFQQLVRTLAPVSIGDEPSAYSILLSAVNGQRAATDSPMSCGTCGEPKAEKRCSACKSVQYCNQECQKLHWFTHKKCCAKLAAKEDERQAEKPRESTDDCNDDKTPD